MVMRQSGRSHFSSGLCHLVALAFAICAALATLGAAGESDPTASPTDAVGARHPFLAEGQPDRGWPNLRGPDNDGRSPETNLADAWKPAGPPVLWTCELGQGFSGFVAWQDRVATQYQTLAGQYVACLAADSGQTIWRYRYDWPYEAAGIYPGPRATPTYADGRLFFAAPDGRIGCLDAGDGELIWSVDLQNQHGGKGTEFGYACSPTVIEGKVVLPVGGPGASLVALSVADGSLVWKAGDDAASYTPAIPIALGGRRLVLGYLQNALVCHDLRTGEQVWRRQLSAGYDEHSAWPIYQEPYLWLTGPFQAGSELLELSADPAQPARLVWKSKLMSNDVASSVLFAGAIYGFDLREAQTKAHRPSRGQFLCIDFLTGKEHWAVGDPRVRRSLEDSPAAPGTHVGHATLIVADNKLVLLNDTGELILARASSERYEELGRVTVLGGEIGWTPPTLYRGRLFARNHSRAVCVYLGLPELLEPRAQATAVAAADIPQSPYVDWAALILGIEPEYAFDIPSRRWLAEWFLISLLGLMGTSAAIALTIRILAGPRFSLAGARWTFWALSFVFGALGTSVLSPWRGDFVFTWPVSLFVAFQVAVYGVRFRNPQAISRAVRWRSRLAGLFFVLTCLAYFLICRRLSLVFEWAFLVGFGPAAPFVLAGAALFRQRAWRAAWECLLATIAFAAFYGSVAVVLLLKS